MQYIIERSFAKSAKELPKNIQLIVSDFIGTIEGAMNIASIANIKKLKTNKKDQRSCYRYKMGNYRLGFILEEENIIRLVIADHRKNIYKNFP